MRDNGDSQVKPSPEREPEPESPFLDEAQFATDYASVRPDWPEPGVDLESPFSSAAFAQLQPEGTPEPEIEDLEDLEREPWEPDEPRSFDEEAPFSEGDTGIIDGDNRVRVKRTVGVPWRWICKVTLKDDRGRYHSGGTGVLVSDRHVLTAAHVVYPEYVRPNYYSIEITPALNAGDEPFGVYAISAKPWIPKHYDPNAKNRFNWDYALITCREPLGRKVFSELAGEPLCYWGHPKCGANTVFARLDPRTLNGTAAVTAGYPQRKGGMQLWCAAGILAGVDRRRRTMVITADTTEGQSGSPVWVRQDNRYLLVGIAAGAGKQVNTVVRVTREFIRQIRAWIREDGDTPTMEITEDVVAETHHERYHTSKSSNFNGTGATYRQSNGKVVDGGDKKNEEEAHHREDDHRKEDDELPTNVVEFDQEESIEEDQWMESEAYDDGITTPELGDEMEIIYDENEEPPLEEEENQETVLRRLVGILPRMKFEFQTRNLVWRNDGKNPSSKLERKYGPDDFLVDQKGVRLESETDGVLEFETEWFRKWPALKKAIESAFKMTVAMNGAVTSNFDEKRKAFPFSIDHLRRGSAREMRRGYWSPKPGREGRREKILGMGEELEVEIVDSHWIASIQSSECFLLHQFEDYLRQHERKDHYVVPVIQEAMAILESVRPDNIARRQLVNLESFIQILVYYIKNGQNVPIKGHPSKFAFWLMSRTNFASMYRLLLTKNEKKLFGEIVSKNVILEKMTLDRTSPFFIEGYGTKAHHAGPTVYRWLVGIRSGRDLLSGGKDGLSAAMGRYAVERRKRKKDYGLVKFETRETIMGRTKKAVEWAGYASVLYGLATERRRRPVSWVLAPLGSKADDFLGFVAAGEIRSAIGVAYQQGVADKSKVTDLIFHSLHPELVGRRIRKGERALVRKWLQIQKEWVEPVLRLEGAQETIASVSRPLQGEIELVEGFVEEFEVEGQDELLVGALPALSDEVLEEGSTEV